MTDRPKPSHKKQEKTKKPAPEAAKTPAKKKIVAAEAAEAVRRAQAAPPAPPASAPSAIRPASRHVAEAADSVRRAQTAKPASPPAAKATPAASPAAPKPASPHPAAKAPAPAALKAEPKPASAKTKPQPTGTAQTAPAKTPKPAPAAKAASTATASQSPIAEALAAFAAAKPAEIPAVPWAAPANALAGAAETLQQSFRAAGRGSVAVNRKLLDFARVNLASGLDHAKSLASARNPLEAAQLQWAYLNERLKVFASQVAELRALSSECLAETSEPFRQKLGRKQLGGEQPGREHVGRDRKSDRSA
ncbi:phasin family protein [Methyloceanibacter sp.]|jgi:hypothetical protein|uniref:phasin family protein n=1 Tax=Methyloceanibacter sp. TaxID=1965321 RepID=UPI00351BD3D1